MSSPWESLYNTMAGSGQVSGSVGDVFGQIFGTGNGTGGFYDTLFGAKPDTGLLNGLNDVYGQYQSNQNQQAANQQVQSLGATQQQALKDQLAAQQAQAAQARADAMTQYNSAKGQYDTQNAGLNDTIGTLTGSLNALSDPNSAYMQNARQAIERKDAAAGRRSQWGERETQLAGTLADYVGKYSPGLNNSITAARNQITGNNNSLASIYDTMNKTGNLSDINITNLINAMNAASTTANTNGRNAANAAQNAQSSLIGSGIGGVGSIIKGLGGLFGGGGGSQGITDYFGNLASQQYGITGMGNQIGDQYGFTGGNFGPSFGGTSISDGLSNGYNPFTSSLLGGGYSGGYASMAGNGGITDYYNEE